MRKKISEVPPMGLFLFAGLAALILFAAVGSVRRSNLEHPAIIHSTMSRDEACDAYQAIYEAFPSSGEPNVWTYLIHRHQIVDESYAAVRGSEYDVCIRGPQ